MTRRSLPISALLLGVGLTGQALAQSPGCPPDEWFCDDAAEPPAPAPATPPAEATPPEPQSEPGAPAAPPGPTRWSSDAPADDPREIDLRTADAPEPDADAEVEATLPWSVNLRLSGVLLGESRRRDDGQMGGAGISLRYQVNRVLTLDGGLDGIIGTDYNGYERSELSLSASALLFLSRHPAVRTYGIFGLNTSAARVDIGGVDESWGYFGAHAGLGLEVPLSPAVALNFDFVGFIRGRTDAAAAARPEFTDAWGRVTNTAGGGLFRAGVSLFW